MYNAPRFQGDSSLEEPSWQGDAPLNREGMNEDEVTLATHLERARAGLPPSLRYQGIPWAEQPGNEDKAHLRTILLTSATAIGLINLLYLIVFVLPMWWILAFFNYPDPGNLLVQVMGGINLIVLGFVILFGSMSWIMYKRNTIGRQP